MRVGVSQTLVVRALAAVAGVETDVMTHRLMGQWSPSAQAFAALMAPDGSADEASRPYPFCLAYPLEQDVESLGPRADWQAEWKWDGIRAQLIRRAGHTYLWSRGEEVITARFPEVVAAAAALPDGTVLDGEVLAWDGDAPAALRATAAAHRPAEPHAAGPGERPGRIHGLRPAGGGRARRACRCRSAERRAPPRGPDRAACSRPAAVARRRGTRLGGARHAARRSHGREASRATCSSGSTPRTARAGARATGGSGRSTRSRWMRCSCTRSRATAGGRRCSPTTRSRCGRTANWCRWRRRTRGCRTRRSSRWTAGCAPTPLEKFGPVRRVTPALVFEVAFENVQRSTRHKSGVAVRFPRIARWRHDKTARGRGPRFEALIDLIKA